MHMPQAETQAIDEEGAASHDGASANSSGAAGLAEGVSVIEPSRGIHLEPPDERGADAKPKRACPQIELPAASTPSAPVAEASKPIPPPDREPAAEPGVPTGKPNTPGVYKDRRGRRRARPATRAPERTPAANPASAVKAPADVRLRLMLHPIQQTVGLALVLGRPEGFPASLAICADGPVAIDAFDESRYDDLDIEWLPDTLSGELRFESTSGYRWVRSARRIQIFSSDPGEAGLISVSAAKLGAEHAVVCKAEDAETVRAAAVSAGSPRA